MALWESYCVGNCVLAEVAAILERFIAVALLLTTVKVAKSSNTVNATF